MITPVMLKEHVETDLSTEAIQRLLDDASEEIIRRYGENYQVTEQHSMKAPHSYMYGIEAGVSQRRVWSQQQISSVLSLKEGPTFATADLTALTLDAETDGFRIVNNGYAIERIGVDFDRCVLLTYIPRTDVKRRDRVTVDLVRLAIQYNALSGERVGDWNGSYVEYQKERESILSTLNGGRRTFA